MRFDGHGDSIVDQDLMRYFSFYWELLPDEEPIDQALARLLSQIEKLPPRARYQAEQALNAYLSVEQAKQD